MSLHYLLDGYNILQKMPRLSQKKLETAREGFLSVLRNRNPQGSALNQMTVVFDGRDDVFGGQSNEAGLRVIFTSGETADEKIVLLVEKSSNPRQCVVITDDRTLQYAVRARGAKIVPVDEFLSRLKSPQARKMDSGADTKAISVDKQAEINQELLDIWLKKTSGLNKKKKKKGYS